MSLGSIPNSAKTNKKGPELLELEENSCFLVLPCSRCKDPSQAGDSLSKVLAGLKVGKRQQRLGGLRLLEYPGMLGLNQMS